MTWFTSVFQSGTVIVQKEAAPDVYWYVYAGTAPTEWERDLVRYRVAEDLASWLNDIDEAVDRPQGRYDWWSNHFFPIDTYGPHWSKSLRREGDSLVGDYGIKLIATILPRLKKDETGREDETDADRAAKQALIDHLFKHRSPAWP